MSRSEDGQIPTDEKHEGRAWLKIPKDLNRASLQCRPDGEAVLQRRLLRGILLDRAAIHGAIVLQDLADGNDVRGLVRRRRERTHSMIQSIARSLLKD